MMHRVGPTRMIADFVIVGLLFNAISARAENGRRADDPATFATAALLVQDSIAADQELRRRIDAAELKDYGWPNAE